MSRLVIGTAGHIDHGKSALVRALTGIEPDRLKEEQARGISIDLGFAHATLGDLLLAFVDVPGHERFIRNMLAGATGIDAVVLVVAADESVMPQTREHLDICRMLDIRAGVIALTRADLAEPELRTVARDEVRALVAGTFLERAPIVDVSSTTGEGLDALRDALRALAGRVPARAADGPVRLPIDRVFTLRGFGTIVTGTLVSGTLRAGSPLVLLPQGVAPRVRGLHVHGRAVDEASAGDRVAVNVGDVPVQAIARGDTLASEGAFEPTRRIDVRLELLAEAPPLRHGSRVRFHQGASEVMARVALARVIGEERGSGGAAVLPGGGAAYARLRFEAPVVVTRGDRFVIRRYSPMATIGGGVVLDPLPRRSGLRTAASLASLAQIDLRGDDPRGAAAARRAAMAFVRGEQANGLSRQRLARRLGVGDASVHQVLEELDRAGEIVRAGDVAVARDAWDAARRSLIALVRARVDADPESEGAPREEARDRLHLDARLFEALVDRCISDGAIAGRERLTLPGRIAPQPLADPAVTAIEARLVARALNAGDSGELAAETGLALAAVERALTRLAREKRLVRLGGLCFHRTALDGLIADVRALRQPDGVAQVDVAAFKARYGLSRKYAIPLLEFLDRERVTRRVGDVRVVL